MPIDLAGVKWDDAPAKAAATPESFRTTYGPAAERAAKALNVDPRILLGQWGLETGWGKSVVPGTNNLGNIKDFSGSGVGATDNMTGSRDKYRQYDSPDAFADDFASLIQRKYPGAVGAKTPEDFAKALKSGGYAEDPGYVAKVAAAARMTGPKDPSASRPGLIPSAQAATPPAAPIDLSAVKWDEPAPLPDDTPRVEVRGTSADVPVAQPLTRGARIAQGAIDPINGGAQLLTRMLPTGVVNAGNQLNNYIADKTGLVARLPEGGVDEQVRAQEAEYAARRAASGETGLDGYRLLGNAVSPVNLAVGAGTAVAGARMAATAVPTIGRAVGLAAGAGAASGALNPITDGAPESFAGDKLKQMAIGGAAGAVGGAVGAGVSRLVSPAASTNPQNQLLEAAGVRQTVGQALGGFANNVEQRLTSVPILGDAIRAARGRAQDDLRRAAQNRVTDPIQGATRVAETGTEGIAAVSRQVDNAYDAARNAMGAFRIDQQGAQELATVRNMVNNLAPAERNAFDRVWSTLRRDISPNGTIDASVFKRIDSELGRNATNFGKGGPYEQQLGEAFQELQRAIQQAGARANPRAGAMFAQADEAFANLVRVQKAAAAAAAQDGAFTPGQLTQAVRAADGSARKNAVSQGSALMQDLSSAGNRLSNTVPDSGTAGRLGQFAAGGAAFADPVLTGSLLAGGAGVYSQPVQSVLRAAVTRRPGIAQPVGNALLQASPGLGPLAAQMALQNRK